MRLAGKVAIISGAASGMGAATARIFAREGAKVRIADLLEHDAVISNATVFKIYLNHVGYRVLEGPTAVTGQDRMQQFRVELQRPNSCTVVFPIQMVHARSGAWLVNAVDLASLPNPADACKR